MAIGLLGRKLGMTHVYDDYGRRMAVTAIQAGPCVVTRVRAPKPDGYRAVQVGFEPAKEGALSKPVLGQFKRAGVEPQRYVREFRLADGDSFTVGQQLTVELFKENEIIDVMGTSIGKGFQGGMKRWGWSGGRATHGSTQHRAPGSIGSTTFPGRVVRGHHLPGHMGARQVTLQNLRIVRIDAEANLLLIAGAIPGPARSVVVVHKSVKKPGVIKQPQAIQQGVVEEDETAAKKAKPAAKKK